MYTAFQLKERHRAVSSAVATQRLEGLNVDPQTVADMHRIADGQATAAQVVEKIKQRVAAGEFRVKPA